VGLGHHLPAGPHPDWSFAWERAIFAWIDAHRLPLLDAVFIPISIITEWGLLWLVFLALLFVFGGRDDRRLAVLTAVAMTITSVGVIVPLMHMLPRERPFMVLDNVSALSLPITTPSFPSGHVKTAALMAVVFGAERPRHRFRLAFLAVLISYSRLYCGMHWPLDILMGAVLGIAAGLVVLRFRHRKDVDNPEPAPAAARRSTPSGLTAKTPRAPS
jgi:membrane-associated phospholipid phosphatase